MTLATQTRETVSFGPFRLMIAERLLLRGDVPVQIGSRALDALIKLILQPNECVSKAELMAYVWPDVTVEEVSLRFHIASLRKALDDGTDGARYITNERGRGYRFVAPVSFSSRPAVRPEREEVAAYATTLLPARPERVIGRADDVRDVLASLATSHFVTIVGPGGVGKTTVAVSVAHDLMASFGGAVLFVDLGTVSDSALVPTYVASVLGVSVRSSDPTQSIIAFIREKRILVILDCCEHVIDGAAGLAEQIFLGARDVHILATSREALRVTGERVHPILPLAVPPIDRNVTAFDTVAFPATQLFLERAASAGAHISLTDENLEIVANICRRLDGMALAIELAAGRVATYGLQQIGTLLDQRLSLVWTGKRTAPARQKTLRATMDWSFGLLSDVEKVILRRLAVFVGHFTLEAAASVLSSPTIGKLSVMAAVESLVAKSMVATRSLGAAMQYRVLDTTRSYALEIDLHDPELRDLPARHALHYRKWCEEIIADWQRSSGMDAAAVLAGLGNVRAALSWCFDEAGDVSIGASLASSAAPVFLAMSLLPECQRWSERAIGALSDTMRNGKEEMLLQTAMGQSLMFTQGNTSEAHAALKKGLTIAQNNGGPLDQIRVFGPLYSFHLRIGDFRQALEYATRSWEIGKALGDAKVLSSGSSLRGISLHMMGDLEAARQELEAGFRSGIASPPVRTVYFGFDHINWAGGALARTLWQQGYPSRALLTARNAVAEAARMEHPVTLSFVLNWVVPVFIWAGDVESAEKHISWMLDHARIHSFAPYLDLGSGFRGELLLRKGDKRKGVAALEAAINGLQAARYEVMTTGLRISLVTGLSMVGREPEALELADRTIALIKVRGDLSYLAEALRVRANVCRQIPEMAAEEAESCLMQSIDCSLGQGARGWHLRAASDLASLWIEQGRTSDARQLLASAFERFDEGLDTEDLMRAKAMLKQLA